MQENTGTVTHWQQHKKTKPPEQKQIVTAVSLRKKYVDVCALEHQLYHPRLQERSQYSKNEHAPSHSFALSVKKQMVWPACGCGSSACTALGIYMQEAVRVALPSADKAKQLTNNNTHCCLNGLDPTFPNSIKAVLTLQTPRDRVPLPDLGDVDGT